MALSFFNFLSLDLGLDLVFVSQLRQRFLETVFVGVRRNEATRHEDRQPRNKSENKMLPP
jgi:hypothetical protein